ncbi:amino acid transporter [Naematelia encephala]|uniref:Amino acid transporter n=1 Tax=Naematelia encephala TaxID=71784 RepID=A0A1Y2AXV3_9TREE|nr:amino acid transporter [Naematelia encephala]
MSFDDGKEKVPYSSDTTESAVTEVLPSDSANLDLANDPHRGLRMRHVQLIAISGSIGSALFVSIGDPLTSAGPLGLLIGVALWSLVVWAANNCLIEMTVLLPLDGGFVRFASRFVDKSLGMALGWNYLITQWALICFELTAINVIVEYWTLTLSPAVCISVALVLLFLINIWSVRWYGEIEFFISVTKLFLIIGLTLYTFITMVGGNPIHDKYGFRFWKTPGPFAGITNFREVITGIFDAVSWGTFAIVGPDYISLIGGEVKNPRRILPKAFNSTIYRIALFYLTGSLCVGIVSSSTDENLLGAIAAGSPGAAKSPYVISMNRLGIPILPSLVNAVILISLFSTANSFTFVASRVLLSLAQKGQAPRVFARLNRHGVPWLSVIVTLAISCLAYLSVSSGTVKVLNWWIDLVTAAQLVTWTCIAIAYLRFRAGLKAQNLLNTNFLPARGHLQPFSGWYLLVWSPIVLFFSGYYVFLPGAFTAPDFVFAYGSVFIFLAILIASKFYQWFVKKDKVFWIPAKEIDFVSDLEQIEELTRASEEKREIKSASRTMVQKVSDYFF